MRYNVTRAIYAFTIRFTRTYVLIRQMGTAFVYLIISSPVRLFIDPFIEENEEFQGKRYFIIRIKFLHIMA